MGLTVIHNAVPTTPSNKALTPESAVARAKDMAPVLASRALEAEQLRRIPHETIDELQASGLMQLMQPRRYGGSELGLGVLMDVVLD